MDNSGVLAEHQFIVSPEEYSTTVDAKISK